MRPGKMPRHIGEQWLAQEIREQRQEIERPCDSGQFRVLTRLASNPDTHLAVSFGGGSVPALAGDDSRYKIAGSLHCTAPIPDANPAGEPLIVDTFEFVTAVDYQ